MNGVDISDCRMILSSFPVEDRAFLEQSNIILLAGGDVEAGWNIFESANLKEVLVRTHLRGALLMGVSAGAVQLGLCGCRKGGQPGNDLFDTFGLAPFVIGVHEEDWRDLTRVIRLKGAGVAGIGIPAGGGLLYHSGYSLEPVRHPCNAISVKEGVLTANVLLPGSRISQAVSTEPDIGPDRLFLERE